ncbi:MAG: GTP pyrophosphokinase [Methylococcales bacterium]|nr:GTP pyrophosphokinase [Methylococcales bacterium]
MTLIEKSLTIALRAYTGKTDKAGRDYLHHPLRLMAKMTTDTEMAVALLHDVIEDSDITATDLLAEGIPSEVVEAVLCLTKQAGENYPAFILRAKQNTLARKVKLADIEDNINVLRLLTLSDTDLARIAKYHAAWRVLNAAD